MKLRRQQLLGERHRRVVGVDDVEGELVPVLQLNRLTKIPGCRKPGAAR